MKPPEKLEDVRQEHRDFVATEIMGWRHSTSFPGAWNNGGIYSDYICKHTWNPFTKIEHSKVLDGWLIEKNLRMRIFLQTDKRYRVEILDEICRPKLTTHEKFYCGHASEAESHARTAAIMKAHQKLEGE